MSEQVNGSIAKDFLAFSKMAAVTWYYTSDFKCNHS